MEWDRFVWGQLAYALRRACGAREFTQSTRDCLLHPGVLFADLHFLQQVPSVVPVEPTQQANRLVAFCGLGVGRRYFEKRSGGRRILTEQWFRRIAKQLRRIDGAFDEFGDERLDGRLGTRKVLDRDLPCCRGPFSQEGHYENTMRSESLAKIRHGMYHVTQLGVLPSLLCGSKGRSDKGIHGASIGRQHILDQWARNGSLALGG